MYRACLGRTGYQPQPVAKRLMLLRQMERKTEDAFAESLSRGDAQGMKTQQDLMNLYAMMLASEERALQQFPALAELFRATGDVATADAFDQVTHDEADALSKGLLQLGVLGRVAGQLFAMGSSNTHM